MKLLVFFASLVAWTLAACVLLVALPPVASARSGDFPIITSRADAPGDALNGGPDLSNVKVTVGANGSITFAATLANRNGLNDGESVQFFIDGPNLNSHVDIAVFSQAYLPPTIATWTGSAWQDNHYIDSSWDGPTFSATTTLDDLRNSLHSPVVPGFSFSVGSYTKVNGASTLSDTAPDGGLTMSVPTTLAATTTPAPTNPTPTKPPALKPVALPKCFVPKVVGKTLARAVTALRARHCALGVVVRAPKKHVASGLVFLQRPSAGELRNNGARVTVWVAKRP